MLNPILQSQLESITKLRRTIDETINETDEDSSMNSKDFNGVMESKQSLHPKIRPKLSEGTMLAEDRIKCKPPQYGVPFNKSKNSVIDSLEFSQDEQENGRS
jgi:hypothetical protein